jgi:hypothetical protein
MRLFELTVRLGEEMEKGLVERGLTRARAAVIWQLHQRGPVTSGPSARPCGSARATSPGCWTPWKPAAMWPGAGIRPTDGPPWSA